MKLIADQKRRVVLPRPVKPGDALEVISKGDRIVLTILKKAGSLPSARCGQAAATADGNAPQNG